MHEILIDGTSTTPTVSTAATANFQAAFRGYRTRERLRMLPAREAECAIKALHRNSEGFRRLCTFLVFYALYFALVFTGFDIPFERAVEQGLRSHVESASMKWLHEK